ncbi:HAD family hydrolase [Cyanobium sp. Morenito 9A2]|uniref:HAD family hydrolase n=1 Tax=Cyanobium sp. Morenito 9A2 TaxID=2823718 RepID=UPI0020CBD48D|nr:HAD hydrolase-like protein [Cyanobium sp. Morenito 9A2]MCP9848782.1 HAD hydrolase-like protein [Cyanobium sp. Morenito 9A2]
MKALTICFDLDGTLLHSAPAVHRSLQEACRRNGVTPPSLEALSSCMGPPLASFLPELLSTTRQQTLAVIDSFRVHHDSIGCFDYELFPSIEGLLTSLKQRGHLLYVVTNKPLAASVLALNQHGLRSAFENIYSPDGSWRPPTPGRCEKASTLTMLNSLHSTNKLIYVGDTYSDRIAAERADIHFVHASYGYGVDKAAPMQIRQPIDLLTYIETLDNP